jgi:hypothetical protein
MGRFRVIDPEISAPRWRAGGTTLTVPNTMLKRYGDQAEAESAMRSAELATNGDSAGAAVWRRVTDAIGQLTNTIPPGLVH